MSDDFQSGNTDSPFIVENAYGDVLLPRKSLAQEIDTAISDLEEAGKSPIIVLMGLPGSGKETAAIEARARHSNKGLVINPEDPNFKFEPYKGYDGLLLVTLEKKSSLPVELQDPRKRLATKVVHVGEINPDEVKALCNYYGYKDLTAEELHRFTGGHIGTITQIIKAEHGHITQTVMETLKQICDKLDINPFHLLWLFTQRDQHELLTHIELGITRNGVIEESPNDMAILFAKYMDAGLITFSSKKFDDKTFFVGYRFTDHVAAMLEGLAALTKFETN